MKARGFVIFRGGWMARVGPFPTLDTYRKLNGSRLNRVSHSARSGSVKLLLLLGVFRLLRI